MKHLISLPQYMSNYINNSHLALSKFVQNKITEKMQSEGIIIPKKSTTKKIRKI